MKCEMKYGSVEEGKRLKDGYGDCVTNSTQCLQVHCFYFENKNYTHQYEALKK